MGLSNKWPFILVILVWLILSTFTFIMIRNIQADPCFRWTADGAKHEWCLTWD